MIPARPGLRHRLGRDPLDVGRGSRVRRHECAEPVAGDQQPLGLEPAVDRARGVRVHPVRAPPAPARWEAARRDRACPLRSATRSRQASCTPTGRSRVAIQVRRSWAWAPRGCATTSTLALGVNQSIGHSRADSHAVSLAALTIARSCSTGSSPMRARRRRTSAAGWSRAATAAATEGLPRPQRGWRARSLQRPSTRTSSGSPSEIDERGEELAAIYHSHTAEPAPSHRRPTSTWPRTGPTRST